MTTKTREEAIEEVKRQVEIQQKDTGLCGQLEYTDREVFARCFKGGEFFNVVEEFTPPKPEFEKGTLGRFANDNGMCHYGRLSRIEKNVYYSNSHTSTFSTFTPIYQTDPIETLAFELACSEIQSSNRKCASVVDVKEYFISKAKERSYQNE